MSGFSFGTPTTSAGGVGGAFGQNTTAAPPTQSGFNFGTPTGFNFGATPQQQPAPAPQSGGFNFSVPAATSAAPAFGGLGSTPAPSFGAAPTFGGFGATAAPPISTSAAPAFGGFSTATTAAAATPAPTFGGFGATPISSANSAPPFSGFGLATPGISAPSTAPPPAFGGFGLTVTTAAPAFGTLTAGLTAVTSAAPVFGRLGPPPVTTSAPPFGALTSATTTTTSAPAPSFGGFGLKTTTPGFNFGTPAAATPITSSLGSSTLTTPAGTLNFGTTATTTTASALGTFGLATTTGVAFAPKTNYVTPLFGSAPATQTATLPLTATTAAPVPSLGLGGSDLNATQPKSSEGKQDNIKVKDIIIPAPIAETVENIRTFIKQQKSSSSDIARATIRKLANVSNEIQSFEWSLQEISNCVEKNYSQIKLLRAETATAIQSMEMAQRTHETPVGLQFENLAPLKYFQNLVQKYEADMLTFRNQIELTEKHMRSLTNPQSFTSEDLKRGLQQIHESFIALAGRLHEIHQKVETQKEHYLNLRKYYLKDLQNVFAELETDNQDLGVANISSGPTPFSSLTGAVAVSWHNRSNSNRNLGGGFSGGGGGSAGVNSNTSQQLIGSTDNMGITGGIGQKPLFGGSGFGTVNNQAFNLQTPPLGAKRNKQ